MPDIVVEEATHIDLENGQSGHISKADVGPQDCHFEAMDIERALVLNLEDVNLASKSSIDFTFAPKRDTSTDVEQNSFEPQSLEKSKTLHNHIEGTNFRIFQLFH